MAQDFLNQSDRDVQRLVEDLEDVIRSPLETDMATVKQARFINLLLKVTKRFFLPREWLRIRDYKTEYQENLLDGFGNDQFINQMLQSNNNGMTFFNLNLNNLF